MCEHIFNVQTIGPKCNGNFFIHTNPNLDSFLGEAEQNMIKSVFVSRRPLKVELRAQSPVLNQDLELSVLEIREHRIKIILSIDKPLTLVIKSLRSK